MKIPHNENPNIFPAINEIHNYDKEIEKLLSTNQ